jgi:hypothetical protein
MICLRIRRRVAGAVEAEAVVGVEAGVRGDFSEMKRRSHCVIAFYFFDFQTGVSALLYGLFAGTSVG